jgi:phenylacetate-CoA ligase
VPDMAVMEVIDPDTAEVIDIWAQPRSEGELVFTHLDRECAALVRFRTRDHVEIRTDPCPCGRTGPRMVCVGRTDDMLLLRGVNVWPSAVKDVISEFRPRLSGQFRIALDQAGHHHDPPLHIVAEVGASSDAGADRTAIGSEVEAALRAKLIVTCAVELVDAGTFPRTETKEKLLWRRDLNPDPKTAGR